MGRGRISGFHVWKTDMRFLLECNGPLAQPAGDGWNLVGVLSQECHMGRVYWAASVWRRPDVFADAVRRSCRRKRSEREEMVMRLRKWIIMGACLLGACAWRM